jgi:hypothetical protein
MTNGILGRVDPAQSALLYRNNLEALAEHIASASAKFVVLIGDHRRTQGDDLLLYEPAARTLAAAGITDFCSEIDRTVRLPAGTAVLSPEQLIGRVFIDQNSNRAKYLMQNPDNFGVRFHATDETNVTAREVLERAQSELKRSELLTEILWVKAFQKTEPGYSHYSRLQIFSNVATQLDNSTEEQHQAIATARISNPALSRATLKQLCNAHGGVQGLHAAVVAEFAVLARVQAEQRRLGKSDAASAKNILSVTRNRALVEYGMAHGMYGNNPASVVDQIALQGNTSSIEVILLTERSSYMLDYMNIWNKTVCTNSVRTSITVYNFDERSSMPIMQWVQEGAARFRLRPPPGITL